MLLGQLIRERAAWFERLGRPHYALWWIPAGTRPTVDEAKRRLAHLQAHGPSPQAFVFHRSYAANDASSTTAPASGAAEAFGPGR